MLYAVLREGVFHRWEEYDVPPPYRPGSLLPGVVDPLPTYDASTQRIVEGAPVVDVNQVRRTWLVIPLSSEELTLKAIALDLDQARKVYSALKNGSGTDANRLNRVESVLAAVLRYIAVREGLIVQ